MFLTRVTARLALPLQVGWGARVGLSVMVAGAVASRHMESETASSVMAVLVLAGLLVAGPLFIRRSRGLEAKERRAWRLLGTGLMIAGLGVLVLGITWAVNPDVQAFGPADVLYLTGYLVGIVGFAALPHTHGSSLQRIRLLFDGLIGAVAVATLLWVVFLNEVTAALGDAPVWERLVGSTYVLLDVSLLVALMIVLVRRSNLRFDLRLMLFGLGGICQATADTGMLIAGAGKSFAEAEPMYGLHILAVTLFLTAALVVDRSPTEREYADRNKSPLWAIALPYGSAAVMVALLVVRFPTMSSSSDSGLLFATLAIGGLVIARQAVAIRENRRLIEDQQTALVSSISHELRTPLTAMVGFLDLLDTGALLDEQERKEMTAIVNQQASYLSRIVSDLVMLASDNITTIDLEIAPTSVDELAWASISNAAVDSTSVRVHAQRNVVAFVDPGRIQQALANLLSNAMRYGGEKALIVARAEGGSLLLEVHDDGPGVPRKYELLIWEKFERGPHRLNATVPGSGIGLAVTNAIAMAHGGAVGYRRSERLGGACFWLRLPGRVHGGNLETDEPTPRLSLIGGPKNARTA
jgi:signal transduction histidine kinase